ncbi:armadillo-type protein [Paraphysoderma sedebokerense]|nr:armadillo-type protein [Paraphysoderma sedebokerense]
MVKELALVDPIPNEDPEKLKKEGKFPDRPIEDSKDELSEEDLQLKNELEMLVERLKEPNKSLYAPTLSTLCTLIRTSTSSMTAVPKPLKFLRPHYTTIISTYESWPESDDKKFLADILSVLAMTYAEEGKRDSLKYRLKGKNEEVGLWGHEYVRHLAAEISSEYTARIESESATSDLMTLAMEIVPFFLSHNAEADAVDLLLELEAIDKIVPFVDVNTYKRVCLYMVSAVSLLPPPDDVAFLKTAHTIYRKVNKLPEAIILAMRLNDSEMIKDDFESCDDPLLKSQLAFLLARQQVQIETEDESLLEILSNAKLSEHYISLARELEIIEPKTPEDIYKSHLENTRSTTAQVDSARQNLASTFVNAFVNAGFGNDKLMLSTEGEGNSWIYKNKEHGMMSAAASLGMILLWDVEIGLTQIDKYLYSNEEYIKAGALLAIGIVNSGVRNESDPALALLSEYIESKTPSMRIGAIMGLGLAYAGSARAEFVDLLLPLVSDTSISMEISAIATLALGLIFVGTCEGEITSAILQTLMEREEKELKDKMTRFMGLGLALLFLGKQEASDVTLETLKVLEGDVGRQVAVLVEICAYAGTGNVLKVQKMLHTCSDHLDKEKQDDLHQAFAVLGVSLIAMGEEVGTDMALRMYNHLMHYGEPTIRRAVPLGIGLLCASNPLVSVLDTLSKYSHDNDNEVAINAIFAMGIVGAGTNNARLAQMLRQLAGYYSKDPSSLFVVRIAQGLIHMGKGTISINPYHSNKMLMSPVATAGLLTTLLGFTDAKNIILGKSHYMLYHLVSAMYPRLLLTLDEELKPKSVTVRVGQAVDVVGQAGRPKTITGFQTHSTPVLLAHSERAELGTEEFIPLTPVLENFVILKKNPDWMDEDMEK